IARPTQSGGAVGARIDLQALVESILASDAGQSLREAGFEVALFHVQDTHEFEGRYGEAVRLVAAASDTIYRLNLGIYSRDQPFVFEHYRNRSALLVGGIAFLAAAIGLGLWVLLRETTREVETARMRAEFVANVSHELRTPLTSIRMYAETLLFDRVSSEVQRQDYLRTMMRESQRLSRMVGNILDFSRMESGRKSLEFDEVDVGQVVEDTVEEFEPLFDEQGFEVGVDIHPGLPAIPADPEALASAVANLLSNAVKYSTDDRRIQLNVYQQEQFVCVDVADHGIGVPEAERRAVFEKYRRASNAGRSATGTGLGLALVAGIAQSHGGSVDVHPRKEGGSVFRLRLPLTRSS
ncbi:MAG: HAMP domain-containing histidine kinase, partial [Gemmatimonadetes bacterium]|nr:HAMP domain-containing histidine kinase [Gemmatimonadota bacterium]